MAHEQGIELSDFDFWDEINVDQELYEMVCEDLPEFEDDIDHIYRLCFDDGRLEKYLEK